MIGRRTGKHEADAGEELAVVLYMAGSDVGVVDVLRVPGEVVGSLDVGRSLLHGMAVETVEAGGIHHPDGGFRDVLQLEGVTIGSHLPALMTDAKDGAEVDGRSLVAVGMSHHRQLSLTGFHLMGQYGVEAQLQVELPRL